MLKIITRAVLILYTLSAISACSTSPSTEDQTPIDLTLAKENFAENSFDAQTIEPISLSLNKQINPNLPEMQFELTGYNGKSADGIQSKDMITDINIKSTDPNDSFHQEISNLNSTIPSMEDYDYGLAFDDWNGDGYLDMSLHRWEGGSSQNKPCYFWLWDVSQGKFLSEPQLEDISTTSYLSVNPETDAPISAYVRTGAGTNETIYYEYQDGDLAVVKIKSMLTREKEDGLYQVERILKPSQDPETFGEMVVDSETERRVGD